MNNEKDMRLIGEMPFGYDYSTPTPRIDDSKRWEPTTKQEEEQAWVRSFLAACGCVYACDIETLGCTGLAKAEEAMAKANIPPARTIYAPNELPIVETGTRLRLGLAGGGVGLPCFVPGDRFCLVHNTVGGLQDRQVALHLEFIPMVSRELTPQERIQTGLTQKARRLRGGERTAEAMDVLAGQNQEALDEIVEDLADEKLVEEAYAEAAASGETPVPFVPLGGPTRWKCTEHTETNWACRHCVAQAVVEGPLEPILSCRCDLIDSANTLTFACSAEELSQKLRYDDDKNVQAMRIYVRVASFTRKLARD